MPHKFLTFIALTSFTFCTAQSKKEILLDENDKTITVEQFKKKIAPPDYKFTYAAFENDTAIFVKTLLRKEDGILPNEVRKEVLGELSKITGEQIQDNKPIVINYFYEEFTANKRKMIEHYTSNKKYEKFFAQHSEYLQFFIADNEVKFDKKGIFKDKDNKIKSLLFPYPITVSYIIIWPDGRYYRQLSEYRLDEIPDKVKAGRINKR